MAIERELGPVSESVYAQLRGDVLVGYWKPGQKLAFAVLSQRYDTSIGVLREALQRLVEQGLLTMRVNIGFTVSPVSLAGLQDLTEARCEVEIWALRRSLAHGDVAWEAAVLASHHVLASTRRSTADDCGPVSIPWMEAHSAFHDALLDACPNQHIRGIAKNLRDLAQIYQAWSVRFSTVPRDIAGEHRALCDAVVARDSEGAARILREHITLTAESLIKAFEGLQ